ncbi:MAG: rRNA adenine N(6)-methyltransferase family protein, partial [Actinomycetota bacterium]|nr:rRNA adenine N(6)-methyltransferase family protein [Actinomycetota bacterium]
MAVRPRRARVEPPRYARHFLASAAIADAIVEDACVRPGELVLDLGAGRGMLTAALVRRGARVVAVELDPASVAALRRRFDSVVEGDLLQVALPREPFRVVANLPFHLANDVLRRLLDDPVVPLQRADVIVEWGMAVKRAAVWPSTMRGVVWGAGYRFAVSRHLPASAFRPQPKADGGILTIVPRETPLVEDDRFGAFVAKGFRHGLRAVASRAHLRPLGIRPSARPRELDLHQWVALYAAVRGGA